MCNYANDADINILQCKGNKKYTKQEKWMHIYSDRNGHRLYIETGHVNINNGGYKSWVFMCLWWGHSL